MPKAKKNDLKDELKVMFPYVTVVLQNGTSLQIKPILLPDIPKYYESIENIFEAVSSTDFKMESGSDIPKLLTVATTETMKFISVAIGKDMNWFTEQFVTIADGLAILNGILEANDLQSLRKILEKPSREDKHFKFKIGEVVTYLRTAGHPVEKYSIHTLLYFFKHQMKIDDYKQRKLIANLSPYMMVATQGKGKNLNKMVNQLIDFSETKTSDEETDVEDLLKADFRKIS